MPDNNTHSATPEVINDTLGLPLPANCNIGGCVVVQVMAQRVEDVEKMLDKHIEREHTDFSEFKKHVTETLEKLFDGQRAILWWLIGTSLTVIGFLVTVLINLMLKK